MDWTIKQMEGIRMSKSLIQALQRRIEDVKYHKDELMALNGFGESKREPRQAMLGLGLLGGALAGGLFSSFFSDHHSRYETEILETLEFQEKELKTIRAKINTMARAYGSVVNITQHMHEELVLVEDAETMITVLTMVSEQINRWKDGLQDAMTGRLTPDLLTIKDAQKVMKTLSTQNHDGSISLVESENIGKIYSLPAQLVKTKTGMDVVIRIPLYFKKDLFRLYKYRQLPMTIEKGVRVAYKSPIDKYLVIDEINGIYKELETDELMDCINMNNIRLCPHLRLFKRGEEGCLPALINGKLDLARKLCDVMLHRDDDTFVAQINENQMFVDVQTTEVVQTSCFNASGMDQSHREVLVEGSWMLTLQDRCSVRIGNYIIKEKPRTSRMRVRMVETAFVDTAENIIASLDLHDNWIYGAVVSDVLQQLDEHVEPGRSVSVEHLRRLAQASRASSNRLWIYAVIVVEGMIIILLAACFGRLPRGVYTRRAAVEATTTMTRE